jgi:hypothetical protein
MPSLLASICGLGRFGTVMTRPGCICVQPGASLPPEPATMMPFSAIVTRG